MVAEEWRLEMRTGAMKRMAHRWVLAGVGLACLTAAGELGTAQTSTPIAPPRGQRGSPSSPGTTLAPIDGSTTDGTPDPAAAMREAARVRAVSTDRQKRIVEDSEKLLALANELKQEVDKTTKDQMSVEVIKKADEIEKLAHDLKTRMKG